MLWCMKITFRFFCNGDDHLYVLHKPVLCLLSFCFLVKSWRATSSDPGAVHCLDRQAKQWFSLDLYSPFLPGGICGCASPPSLN